MQTSKPVVHSADGVVVQLFANLQLAALAQKTSPHNGEMAKEFERQTWDFLMQYLTTLERPPLRSFDRLE